MQEIIMALLNPNEMLGKPCVFFFLTKISFQVFALFIPIVWKNVLKYQQKTRRHRQEQWQRLSLRSKRNRTGSGFFSLFSMMTLLVLHPEVKSNWLTLRFSVDILDILQNILCWHSTSDIIQSCPNTLFLWWQSVCLFGSCGLCYFWKAFQRHLLSFHSRS